MHCTSSDDFSPRGLAAALTLLGLIAVMLPSDSKPTGAARTDVRAEIAIAEESSVAFSRHADQLIRQRRLELSNARR